MKLKVLGSSSKGNSYILSSDDEVLILEAGVKFSEIKKSLDFDLSKVVGAAVSHLHGDHSQGIGELVCAGIPVLAHESVFSHWSTPPSIIAEHQKQYELGGFKIKPFALDHDVPNFGFYIYHEKIGKTVFITDTAEVEYTFKGLNNIIIEANYSDDIIEDNLIRGKIHPVYEERVRRSHLSIQKCIKWLRLMDLSSVNNIVLCHLSGNNSNGGEFVKMMEENFTNRIHIAKKGLNINFSKLPF